MLIYFLVFVVAFFYFLYTWRSAQAKSSKLFAIIMAYMAIFIGMGDMIGGYDRYIYGEMFDIIANETRGSKNYVSVYYFINGSEWGYFLWEILVSFITRNRYVYILITTIMMYVLYFRAIKRYVREYPLAVIVFLGFFYYFSITYIRQAIAVGIVWNAVDYIWKRDLKRFLLLYALAVSFHNSALIVLPLYFIGSRHFSYRVVFSFLIICLIVGLSPIPQMLLALSGEIGDMTYRTEQYANDVAGVRVDYLLQVSVLLYIVYQNRNVLPVNRKTEMFLNILFFYFGLLLMFIRFGQGGRFGWYMIIAIIYLFTEISINKRTHHVTRNIIVFLCFILFYRITTLWAFNLTPYKTFLTNGYPSGEEYIYERWEYDERYTSNKFYRQAIDIHF